MLSDLKWCITNTQIISIFDWLQNFHEISNESNLQISKESNKKGGMHHIKQKDSAGRQTTETMQHQSSLAPCQ